MLLGCIQPRHLQRQPLRRIHLVAVYPYFPVQVRAGGKTGVANCANHFTGQGTLFTAPLAAINHRDHTPIPINCGRALLDVMLELHNWSNDDGSMKRHELQGIVLRDLQCDGTSLEVSTYAEIKFPFTVPFSRMDSAILTSTVGTTNQVQEGLYLFGVRLY